MTNTEKTPGLSVTFSFYLKLYLTIIVSLQAFTILYLEVTHGTLINY